jgi:hypothetical protein
LVRGAGFLVIVLGRATFVEGEVLAGELFLRSLVPKLKRNIFIIKSDNV